MLQLIHQSLHPIKRFSSFKEILLSSLSSKRLEFFTRAFGSCFFAHANHEIIFGWLPQLNSRFQSSPGESEVTQSNFLIKVNWFGIIDRKMRDSQLVKFRREITFSLVVWSASRNLFGHDRRIYLMRTVN